MLSSLFLRRPSMKKYSDRSRLSTEIKTAAMLYKTNLVGKTFMYVFDGRYIEVIYKAVNFKHLTGVETNLSAKRFYTYAVRGTLSGSHFYFTNTHPYSLCVRKTKHIKEVANLAGKECFLLEDIRTNTKVYKFGTTNMNFSLCMNKELDDYGQEKGPYYVVQSLRDEDCFSKCNNAFVVTHIFSRMNDSKTYTDSLYGVEKITNKEILALLDESVKPNFI